MHKTGTTSIQLNLADHETDSDWLYLTLGKRRNMGAALYAMFSSEPHRYHWFQKRGDTPEQVASDAEILRSQFIEILKSSTAKNSILSGESLTLIDKQGIIRLRDFLKPFFDSIQVIGYVRPPIAFKISFFQQRLKHSNSELNFSDFHLQYRQRFKKFDLVFGRDQVTLKKFDPNTLKNQCIVADFRAEIGMPSLENPSSVRMNESLCREACAILYAYRKFGPDYGSGPDALKENKRILAPLLEMKGEPFRVCQSMVKDSLSLEQKDIQWMENRLGTTLDEKRDFNVGDITQEDQLLHVDGATCRYYADIFEMIYGKALPNEIVPCGERLHPQQAADFLENCRAFCREMIREERAMQVAAKKIPPPRKSGFRVSCLRRLRRITGIPVKRKGA
jgi:hypothetical protein